MRLPGFRKRKSAQLTKAEVSGGVMVALFPSADVAATLAQPGGEPVDQLHLTLAYLGPAAEFDSADQLQTVVAGLAASTPPLTGEIGGIGHFTAGPEPVTWASPDVPGLPMVRQALCEALDGAGLELGSEHGFTPHITLAYDHIDPEVPNLALAFNALSVVIAGERTDHPLIGKNAEETPVSTDRVKATFTAPIVKDEARRLVTGVVMQPNVPDSEGDTTSVEEIEQAAHRYLMESRKSDVQHNEQVAAVVPVESFITPQDMEIAGRGVLKGSWVMTSKVADDQIWNQIVKGDLTGYSIGGTAVRED